MVAAIKAGFAVVAAVMFAFGILTSLVGAQNTPGFVPSSGQNYLMASVGGALIAFITAQLGLAAANDQTTLVGSVNQAMGTTNRTGSILLAIDVAVFALGGLWSVVLYALPSMLAVPDGAAPLVEAPDFITTQATLFGGVVIASLAAFAGSQGRAGGTSAVDGTPAANGTTPAGGTRSDAGPGGTAV